MKRKGLLLLLTIATLAVSAVGLASCGGEESSSEPSSDSSVTSLAGIIYTISEDGTYAEVSGYNNTLVHVLIEDTYEEVPVTRIRNGVFSGIGNIVSVDIPEGITHIGDGAFNGCIGLTSVTLPDSLTYVGANAFQGCSALTEFSFGNHVTALSPSVLEGCSSLTAVTIPNSVTTMAEKALKGCTSLTTITIPDSVNVIGEKVFEGCSALADITIGSGVNDVNLNAFDDCDSLRNISVAEGNAKYSSVYGDLCSKDKKALLRYAMGKTGVIVIAGSISRIGERAFYGCKNANRLIVPNNVVSIGERAFENCKGLTTVEISNGVQDLGEYTFYNCTDITDVTLGNGITSIGRGVFWNCGSLQNIKIPNSVISIGSVAFAYCRGLDAIEIPDSVTEIGFCAFEYCSGLDSIKIGNGVRSIAEEAFRYCGANSITMGNSVENIGNSAFLSCYPFVSVELPEGTGVLKLPESVKSIGSNAFSGCYNLTSVTIGKDVAEIGRLAFSNCKSLKEINVAEDNSNYQSIDGSLYSKDGTKLIQYATGKDAPFALADGVKVIGESAVSYCESLTRLVIPADVERIEDGFYGCKNLTEVEILSSETDISEYVFTDCPIENIIIPINGVSLVSKIGAKTVTLNGSGVIPAGAFEACTSLTTVKLSDGITGVGSNAFYGCSNLVSIEISNSVTSIAEDTFTGCPIENVVVPVSEISAIPKTMLKTVTLNGTGAIPAGALENCSSLTEVKISEGITYVGSNAFNGCTGLISIELPNGLTNVSEETFAGCPIENAVVPVTLLSYISKDLLKTVTLRGDGEVPSHAFYECSNLLHVDIDEGITGIGMYAFYNCSGLTDVAVPSSITSLGYHAFDGCNNLTYNTHDNALYLGNENNPYVALIKVDEEAVYGLTSCEIHSQTKVIGGSAFSSCYSLTEIKIPDGVVGIGVSAFSNCQSLTELEIPVGVTKIGTYAFESCRALTHVKYNATNCADFAETDRAFMYAGEDGDGITVTIGANVEKIPAYAFYAGEYASKLISVKFETGSVCREIGEKAFAKCNTLFDVEIPACVTSIGSGAFSECATLTRVTYNATNCAEARSVFEGSGWDGEGITITFGANVERVPAYLFYHSEYASLDIIAVVFEEGSVCASIGEYAFFSCTKLTSVTFKSANALESIENRAFYGCSALTSITIGSNVTAIGYWAFGDSGLDKIYYMDTLEQWNTLLNDCGSTNPALSSATVYYYVENESDVPTDGGQYWRYVDGVPTVW